MGRHVYDLHLYPAIPRRSGLSGGYDRSTILGQLLRVFLYESDLPTSDAEKVWTNKGVVHYPVNVADHIAHDAHVTMGGCTCQMGYVGGSVDAVDIEGSGGIWLGVSIPCVPG